jgi:TolA-binding protein
VSDPALREFNELKREVVEARNQSIKTDNQIKNLSLDMKGFETRFDNLEKRARFATIGAYAIVALTISVAAYFISSISIEGIRENAFQAAQDAERLKQELAARSAELDTRLKRVADDSKVRSQAQSMALELLGHLKANRKSEAARLLPELDMALLSPLERQAVGPTLTDFQTAAGEEAYRNGRNFLSASRKTDAIKAFRESLRISPEGRYANSGRYLLGITLRESRKYSDAIEVFEAIRKKETDRNVIDEVLYWHGYSLLQVGDADGGRKILESVVASGSRHASAAKTQLAGLAPTAAPTIAP